MFYRLDENDNPVAVTISPVGFWESDRHVAFTQFDDCEVSTVFLGLDHGHGHGKPVLWETLVFGGKLDGEMERYTTKADAERGHEEMCVKINEAIISAAKAHLDAVEADGRGYFYGWSV